MSNASLRITYRPLRIGWCVRSGDWEDLRGALLLTHALWGGRFNPIIVAIPGQNAQDLVRQFRVDVLCAPRKVPELQKFAQSFEYLPTPFSDEGLFTAWFGGNTPQALDVYHPIMRLRAELERERDSETAVLLGWASDDPIAAVLLATYGAYPPRSETGGPNYEGIFKGQLNVTDVNIAPGCPVPGNVLYRTTPSEVTRFDLNWDHSSLGPPGGLYVGDSANFDDVVHYWNIRACDKDIVFFDPTRAERFTAHLQDCLRHFMPFAKTSDFAVGLWSRNEELTRLVDTADVRTHVVSTGDTIPLRPPLHYISSKSVLASSDDRFRIRSITFTLPEKPFDDDPEFSRQRFVVSTQAAPHGKDKEDEQTLWSPFVPEMNPFYGRKMCAMWMNARAEENGIGIITEASDDDLTIFPLSTNELVIEIFRVFGMNAELSHAGKIATRLVRQLGGLQGCRVLKIPGVRKLIEAHGPLDFFTRSTAIQTIRDVDPATNKPNFEAHEGLYIEPRERRSLRPEDAFTFLLRNEVFRVGLNVRCPSCSLSFWISLDDIRAKVLCDYCGQQFGVSTQLRDRYWAYRRSGLFGAKSDQGSIPVALTLQQLDTILHGARGVFVTGINIKGTATSIAPCESDFVVAVTQYGAKLQIAVGECKSRGGRIDKRDAQNLARVADAFPEDRVDTFVVFSKTGTYSAEEIDACRAAQSNSRRRVIIFSSRELEPYHVYARTQKDLGRHFSAISLQTLADATHMIYLLPASDTTTVESKRRESESFNRQLKHEDAAAAQLRAVYETHNSVEARAWPSDKQCQCKDCREFIEVLKKTVGS